MKWLAHGSRFFVGVLFLISGFVKIVDPTGTAIKLEEYFYVFAQDLPFLAGFFESLVPASMFFSFLLTILEIVLAVALFGLVRVRLTIIGLLVIIVCFTFLTGYSAILDRVTDCGCFGDAVKLTPTESFLKDIILSFFIGILFLYRKNFKEPLKIKTQWLVISIAAIVSFAFGYYNYAHLPVIDFRPFKVGNNIPDLMNDGEPPIFKYEFTNKETGEKIVSEKYLKEEILKFDTAYAESGKPPTIPDFELRREDNEVENDKVLDGKSALVLVKNFENLNEQEFERINKLMLQAQESGIKVYYILGSSYEEFRAFNSVRSLIYDDVYTLDLTVMKAFIRSSPGLAYLEGGTVEGKWHSNDIPNSIEAFSK